MPSAKEIKSKMRGVRDTMKITKAMYMKIGRAHV